MAVMREFLFHGAIVAMTALAACKSTKAPNSAESIDDQYGIPPLSVPSHMLKSDGFMSNGLLPAQPYD